MLSWVAAHQFGPFLHMSSTVPQKDLGNLDGSFNGWRLGDALPQSSGGPSFVLTEVMLELL
jgi:hypothetical protein